MALSRILVRVALATLLLVLPLQIIASSAEAFRIIASSSGTAGIAQAECCDTGFDGGFVIHTSAYTVDPGPPLSVEANFANAGGSKTFDVERTDAAGTFATVEMAGRAVASTFDIGSGASIRLTNWDENFTGGSIEAASSARLEQVFSVASTEEIYVRPVFQIDGSVSHAAGLQSTLTFNMRGIVVGDTTPSDNILLRIDGGPDGTTAPVDEMLVGPEMVIDPGVGLFLSLQLSTQVSGVPNDIAEGDHFGEVDAYNTLTLLGFEAFADPEFTTPVNVEFMSDSGDVVPTIPEPATALLVGVGLIAASLRRGRRLH